MNTRPENLAVALASRADKARAQTAHADQKAQVLASGLVPTIAAAIAAGAFAGIHGPAAVTGWAAAAIAATAVVVLGMVLWPRAGHLPKPSTPERLLEALTTVDETQRLNLAAAEVIRLERIVTVKFRWLRTAMSLTGTAGLLALATVILAVTN
ncbi:hypothetical protein K3N28_19230 [Glycomyces sp. TRM65418]|uniref:hypothetical protein n=1 Tax=Glycomyces sp. TRM65418 TaxID=2867006 RepID=UPI001CE6BE80|nr:hypothetical protein [Glycomyces sp. TRM65418]MCC3765194.1 hypothetical protein [Glycomyces sp. TRM65418]QZD54819.1 hypothetical protein K3N28_19135 [Glycomyces sp. TRM65418]